MLASRFQLPQEAGERLLLKLGTPERTFNFFFLKNAKIRNALWYKAFIVRAFIKIIGFCNFSQKCIHPRRFTLDPRQNLKNSIPGFSNIHAIDFSRHFGGLAKWLCEPAFKKSFYLSFKTWQIVLSSIPSLSSQAFYSGSNPLINSETIFI